jgi:hypothetical protein
VSPHGQEEGTAIYQIWTGFGFSFEKEKSLERSFASTIDGARPERKMIILPAVNMNLSSQIVTVSVIATRKTSRRGISVCAWDMHLYGFGAMRPASGWEMSRGDLIFGWDVTFSNIPHAYQKNKQLRQ